MGIGWANTQMSYDKTSNMSAEDVVNRIGQDFKRHGGYVVTQCYNTAAHSQGDRKPSLTIYDGDKGYYCYACGESGTHSWLLKQFGIEDRKYGSDFSKTQRFLPQRAQKPANPTPKKSYTIYPLDEIYPRLASLPPDATEILERKGFPWKTWENIAGWRWHNGEIQGWANGIFIPYFVDGKIVAARLRNIGDGPRFMGLPGGESFAFNIDALEKPKAYVCEGETDTLTLHFLGFPAVGVPGSTNQEAIRKIINRASQTGCKLVVIPDQDEAGAKFLERIRIEAFEHRVAIDDFVLPGFKDVNEWFCAVGEEAFTQGILRHSELDIFSDLPPHYIQTELRGV